MISSMVPGLLILACWLLLVLYWKISARFVKPAAEVQSLAGRLARTPEYLGFILLTVAWAYPLGPVVVPHTAVFQWLGVAICALGLVVSIWSRKMLEGNWSRNVEFKQGHKLVEQGPYRYARHPIYTGHLLMALGTALASGLLIAFAGVLSLFLGFWIKLRQEETLLLRHFPEEYPGYKARVKELVPFVF
jgi:protein-S-isoprenylcysteine O-methyltransferase Ste14